MPSAKPQPLRVSGISKRFGKHAVLQDVAFDVKAGSTLAVIGASGCGKTTLLKIIAGLASADTGAMTLGERDIAGLPARERHTVYLYQEPLLFPHLDVFENVAFGLRLRRLPALQVREQVNAMIDELELSGLQQRRPEQLSGGQRQRVAFGRALIVNPALLLLDEPFSNLDPETRTAMQSLLKRVAAEHRITSVFVTHDLKESLRMGDSFAMLDAGRLQNYANAQAFCADPRSGVAQEIAFWNALPAPIALSTR